MPARNEGWIIGLSARAALMWMDALVVLNHASTDHTADILDEISKEVGRDSVGNRLQVINVSDPVWYEMAHRQALLETARLGRATHIATVDADEVLTGPLIPCIKQGIAMLAPRQVLQLPWLCLWRSINNIRVDQASVWGRAYASVAFRDAPTLCWKQRDGYEFHHRHPIGHKDFIRMFGRESGGLFHLQHVRWRSLRAKQALYKMTERIRWPNKPVQMIDELYNPTVNEDGSELRAVNPSWWAPYTHLFCHLNVDETHASWQETECQRLWVEHGAERFKGLNLFEVAQ